MPSLLSTQCRGPVLVATLARAPVNALNGELIDALEQVIDNAVADEGVTLLHLRSEQRAFCAGADLVLIHECFATPQGPDVMTALVRRMQQLFQRLEDASVVTLAEIGGAALGGGLEMALACDLRVAALEARLGLPEAGLGLVPGAGGTQRLTKLCGPGVSRRLILGAEVIDGAEAARLGLVQWARPREQLAAFAAELAASCAASPKAALAANKRCLAAATDTRRNGYAEELRETRALYEHPETRQRVSAFLARRASSNPR
jgi:enoyl-CoA hydratase/carnithine racemase